MESGPGLPTGTLETLTVLVGHGEIRNASPNQQNLELLKTLLKTFNRRKPLNSGIEGASDDLECDPPIRDKEIPQ
jgi:hypothetical protein